MPLSRESARWIIESNLKPLGKPPRVRGWGGWYKTPTLTGKQSPSTNPVRPSQSKMNRGHGLVRAMAAAIFFS